MHARDARFGDRELDARLFRTFFGERSGEPVPQFSSDIGIAWVLLQRLRERHGRVEVIGTQEGRWICRICDPASAGPRESDGVTGEAASVPVAICRAALSLGNATTAVGVGSTAR